MMNINQKVKLHNKFHLVLTDAATGKVKQEAWAYNLILNQGFDRLLDNITHNLADPSTTDMRYALMRSLTYLENIDTRRFGGSIHIGEGTGEMSPTRTTMFTRLGGVKCDYHDRGYDFDELTAYYTQKAVFDELTFQNKQITEVSLGWRSNGVSSIATHALVEDSEGNPVTINKGEYDILTVYSTVFITLSHNYGANFAFVQGASATNRNGLLDWVHRNMLIRGGADFGFRIHVGTNWDAVTANDAAIKSPITDLLLNVDPDKPNKKIVISRRVAANQGNHANGIREVGFTIHERTAEFNGITGARPVFRSIFPISGVWTGKEITGEEVGEGDGSETTFTLKWKPLTAASETIKVDSVAQTRDTDYTINNTTGVIEFATAPGNGLAITADYSVQFIPKDSNHVIDISFTIQFADANAV